MPTDPAIICPECGAQLPAGTPVTQCPNCLLGLGLPGAPPECDQEASGGKQKPEIKSRKRKRLGRPEAQGAPLSTDLGDYELLEEVGRGGMGAVYRARQKSLDRIVALKLLMFGPRATPESVKRFRAEAVATAALQHPNIVAIHEVGVHQGQHFLVMDLVEGRSLARVISEFKFELSDFKRAARYVKTIAEAVHYAHERGILHRDLKPSNILIDTQDQPRVTDFGLARRLEGESELTLSGQVLGSPNYMPPEQASGKRGRVGRRSDVYALGAILYHTLTGRPPLVGDGLAEIVQQVLTVEPVPPRVLSPRLPVDLETLCLKCLEKEPAKRYATAQALAEELGRFLEGKPVQARPVGRLAKSWRWCRRNPRLAFATGAGLLSLLLGLAGTTWQWRHAVAERAGARRNTYAADMNLVLRALEETDLGHALELLDRYRPGADAKGRGQNAESDLRGWEWRYLWARCRSDERFTLCQYSNAITALAFSPDGKWLAVRRDDDAIAVWDTAAKRPMTELRGAPWYKALTFSPRGTLLAWSSENSDGTPIACVRDLVAQQEIARLRHTNRPVSLAFSPDAKELATLDYQGMVHVWNLEAKAISTSFSVEPINWATRFLRGTGSRLVRSPEEQPKLFTDHYGCVLFSPDGRWIAVGEALPQIRLLERATGEEWVIEAPEAANGISALAFSPDSRLLAAGGGAEDNEIHIWDLAGQGRKSEIRDPKTQLNPNQRKGGRGEAEIASPAKSERKERDVETRLYGHSGWIMGLAFSPDGETLASASTDQTVRLWDLAQRGSPREMEGRVSSSATTHLISRGERQRFQGHVGEVWALAWSPDGKHLVTGGKDGSVRYWYPTAKGVAPYTLLAEPICEWGPTFLPDSRTFLALTRDDGAVARWDAVTGKKLETLSFLGSDHLSVDLSSNGRWLALGDANGNVQIWDFPERKLVTNLVASAPVVFCLTFSADAGMLNAGAMAANRALATTFWKQSGWRQIHAPRLELTMAYATDATLSRTGRTMAVGYGDGTAELWDIASDRRLVSFKCGYDTGVVVALSDDETLVATGSHNGPVTLWDTAGRRLWSIARAHRNALHDLAFSPDGQRLVALGTSPKGPAMVWDVKTGRDVATLPGESRWYNHIGFSPDGNTMFAGSMAGPALLWHAPSWEEIEAAEKNLQGQ